MTESALIDRTNTILKQLNDHQFKAHELKSAIPLRSSNALNDATNMTGFADVGLVMDPDDKLKAIEDLKSFKESVSALKFAYLESNIKTSFVAHILDPEGPRTVSLEDNDAMEQRRLQSKAELKQRKMRAAELEQLIRAEAEILDTRLRQTEEDAATASNMIRECEEMEREIALLKNKRSETDRITIEEAAARLDEQEEEMVNIGTKTREAQEQLPKTKQAIKIAKGQLDKLEIAKREMRKELDEREAKGTRDERAEEGCRWITNAMALYSSLMGIRSAYAVGSPPTEMILELDRLTEGDYRTLKIAFDAGGRMSDASLVDSSDDIEDLVEAHLPSQDVRGLVQDVRARILR